MRPYLHEEARDSLEVMELENPVVSIMHVAKERDHHGTKERKGPPVLQPPVIPKATDTSLRQNVWCVLLLFFLIIIIVGT